MLTAPCSPPLLRPLRIRCEKPLVHPVPALAPAPTMPLLPLLPSCPTSPASPWSWSPIVMQGSSGLYSPIDSMPPDTPRAAHLPGPFTPIRRAGGRAPRVGAGRPACGLLSLAAPATAAATAAAGRLAGLDLDLDLDQAGESRADEATSLICALPPPSVPRGGSSDSDSGTPLTSVAAHTLLGSGSLGPCAGLSPELASPPLHLASGRWASCAPSSSPPSPPCSPEALLAMLSPPRPPRAVSRFFPPSSGGVSGGVPSGGGVSGGAPSGRVPGGDP